MRKAPPQACDRYAIPERLIDYLLTHSNTCEGIFHTPAYKPQVDTLYAFVSPDQTLPAPNGTPAPHAAGILAQLTDVYLDNYTPLAIAEVLKRWLQKVDAPFRDNEAQQMLAATNVSGEQRTQAIKAVLDSADPEAQALVAHVMHLCHVLWAAEAKTQANKNKLAYVFGPIFFRLNATSPAELMQAALNMKKINSAVEDMIASAAVVCANGRRILESRSSNSRRDSAPVMMSVKAGGQAGPNIAMKANPFFKM